MPRPSEPKSGLMTTSVPRRSKAAIESSTVWQATVCGTSKPAAESRAVVRYLSTAHSIARGGLITGGAGCFELREGVHAKHDLFERAGRHGADEYCVERPEIVVCRPVFATLAR